MRTHIQEAIEDATERLTQLNSEFVQRRNKKSKISERALLTRHNIAYLEQVAREGEVAGGRGKKLQPRIADTKTMRSRQPWRALTDGNIRGNSRELHKHWEQHMKTPSQASAAAAGIALPSGAKESEGKRWREKIGPLRLGARQGPQKELEVSLFLAFAECMGKLGAY